MVLIVALGIMTGLFLKMKSVVKEDKNILNNNTTIKDNTIITSDNSQTFYATIESIKTYQDGSIHLLVKGLDVNDINYRGEYTFKVTDDMNMVWRGEKLKVSDLNVGSNISITFADEDILDIYPSPLSKVTKIKLLDDEK